MISFYLGFGVFFIVLTESAGLYCLSCTDSVSPRHCHTVRKCNEGEVCFTESHMTENGVLVFDTGCGGHQTCNIKRQHGLDPHYQHSQCVECCSSDLCNNNGCGQTGYPSHRGPACFDCQQISNPTLCEKIRVCDQNQECYIHMEEEFGDVFYTTSCINKHACSSNIDVFGKRNAVHCSRCCQSDLCNEGCESVSTTPSFISPTSNVHTSLATVNFTNMTHTTDTITTPKVNVSAVQSSNGCRGTEFLLVFMENYPLVHEPLVFYITTNATSSLELTSSINLTQSLKSRVDRNLRFTSFTMISLPSDLALHGIGLEYKAVMLRTSEMSTVVSFDATYMTSNDGTLVIPTNKLSTRYVVSTTHPYDFLSSQFAIGALNNNTNIKIQIKIENGGTITIQGNTFSSGDIIPLRLDSLETFQVNHVRDLTGTLVTSNKPIAVYSGNECYKYLPYTGCSHIVSQLPPVDEFDNEYIIPHFYNNSETLVQVVSPERSIVNFTAGKNVSTWHLHAQEHKNITLTTNEVAVVKSDHPVMVTGYAMGSHTNDPYMIVIPGVHQYIDYYKIIIPSGYRDNYLCVIIPTESANNLQLNKQHIRRFNTVYHKSVTLSEKRFDVRTLNVQEGVYVLSTTDHAPFGLLVFGHRNSDGYGFAGNVVMP